MFVVIGRNARAEKIFIYRRRSCACGIRSIGGRNSLELCKQNVADVARNYTLRDFDFARSYKIKGDAVIAMISVGSLAFGYLVMNLFATSANLSGDVCATLFGSTSILTLTEQEVWLSIGLSILMIIAFIAFYHKIFAVTFDEDFARAAGLNVDFYNLIISVVIAIIIVLSMNLVGSLLISAFIIFPALSAMKLFKTFRAVTICSVMLSVICALVGIIVSILAGTPVGSTIVAVDALAFVICFALNHCGGLS